MIYSVCNEKGGSGKTTLAINLATKLSEKGKCLLIDLDPQQSVSAFLSYREESSKPFDFALPPSKKLKEFLESSHKSYPHIVIDTGGRDSAEMRSAMIYSDCCIIPTIPNGLDAVVLEKMLEKLKEAQTINDKLQGVILIQKANSNPFLQKTQEEFRSFVKSKLQREVKLLNSMIFEREAYKRAILCGKGITECKESSCKKAKDEFLVMFNELQKTKRTAQ